MLLRTSVVVALSFAAAVQPPPSVLLALMVRDEEANLRANLPKWLGVADAIVVGTQQPRASPPRGGLNFWEGADVYI